jgi:hypothetical protein
MDIVERLRVEGVPRCPYCDPGLMLEAADEIERLRQMVADRNRAIGIIAREIDKICREDDLIRP